MDIMWYILLITLVGSVACDPYVASEANADTPVAPGPAISLTLDESEREELQNADKQPIIESGDIRAAAGTAEGLYQEQENPLEVNLCELPAIRGSCKEAEIRWFYNYRISKCDTFLYSGCEGNRNNFRSKEECQISCEHKDVQEMNPLNDKTFDTNENFIPETDSEFEGSGEAEESMTTPKPTVCDLAPDTGPCRALYFMWHFDTTEKRCKTFTYGGCRGNANRFSTEEECLQRCSNKLNSESETTTREGKSNEGQDITPMFGQATVDFMADLESTTNTLEPTDMPKPETNQQNQPDSKPEAKEADEQKTVKAVLKETDFPQQQSDPSPTPMPTISENPGKKGSQEETDTAGLQTESVNDKPETEYNDEEDMQEEDEFDLSLSNFDDWLKEEEEEEEMTDATRSPVQTTAKPSPSNNELTFRIPSFRQFFRRPLNQNFRFPPFNFKSFRNKFLPTVSNAGRSIINNRIIPQQLRSPFSGINQIKPQQPPQQSLQPTSHKITLLQLFMPNNGRQQMKIQPPQKQPVDLPALTSNRMEKPIYPKQSYKLSNTPDNKFNRQDIVHGINKINRFVDQQKILPEENIERFNRVSKNNVYNPNFNAIYEKIPNKNIRKRENYRDISNFRPTYYRDNKIEREEENIYPKEEWVSLEQLSRRQFNDRGHFKGRPHRREDTFNDIREHFDDVVRYNDNVDRYNDNDRDNDNDIDIHDHENEEERQRCKYRRRFKKFELYPDIDVEMPRFDHHKLSNRRDFPRRQLYPPSFMPSRPIYHYETSYTTVLQNPPYRSLPYQPRQPVKQAFASNPINGLTRIKHTFDVNIACTLPLALGLCLQGPQRPMAAWFYNVVTKECEIFSFGGCGGNFNRFSSFEECHSTCMATSPSPLTNDEDIKNSVHIQMTEENVEGSTESVPSEAATVSVPIEAETVSIPMEEKTDKIAPLEAEASTDLIDRMETESVTEDVENTKEETVTDIPVDEYTDLSNNVEESEELQYDRMMESVDEMSQGILEMKNVHLEQDSKEQQTEIDIFQNDEDVEDLTTEPSEETSPETESQQEDRDSFSNVVDVNKIYYRHGWDFMLVLAVVCIAGLAILMFAVIIYLKTKNKKNKNEERKEKILEAVLESSLKSELPKVAYTIQPATADI